MVVLFLKLIKSEEICKVEVKTKILEMGWSNDYLLWDWLIGIGSAIYGLPSYIAEFLLIPVIPIMKDYLTSTLA